MTGRATMWTRRRGRVHTRWRTEEREHLGNLVKNGKARSRVGDKPKGETLQQERESTGVN